ncbi:MAG: FtsX-like permease family protein, partial [Anaerolineales bacterium]|nr:FtsX-like permease family protein [Anaerolineales bacterium]
MDDQQETQMLRAMGWFISLLAVLGGGLGMMNTMLMSVFERTREIGVLRALGWRRGRILQMILGEALLLCVVGGAFGIGLGAWLTHALNQVPALAGMLDAAITPALIAQAIVVTLLLGAASGLYPAWRAAQLQPVEAMRYEGAGSQGKSSKFKVQSSKSNPKSQLLITNPQSLISNLGGLALRNIFRQRTRAILTALAIGVGVGMVVALGGMGEGFSQQMSDMGSKNGELTISEAKASDMSLTKVDDKIGRWVTTLPAVQHVSGSLLGFTTMPGMTYFLAF